MIKSIEIWNFQRWKHLKVVFTEGVNVFTGTSNRGKSAIFRAFLWVLDNRPSGNAMMKTGGKITRVRIEFDDGWAEKVREGSQSYYLLSNVKGRVEAVGTDVPDELLAITKMNAVNWQAQHQAYYLLTDTPGNVAKKLNDVIGWSAIDNLFAVVKKKISDTKMDKRSISDQITGLLKAKNDLEGVNRPLTRIERLNDRLGAWERQNKRLVLLEKLVENGQEIQKEVKSTKKAISYAKVIKILLKKGQSIKDEEEILADLKVDIHSLQNLQREKKASLSIRKFGNSIPFLLKTAKILQKDVEKQESLLSMVEGLKQARKEIKETDKLLGELSGRNKKLLAKYKVCPLCKQKIGGKLREKSHGTI